MLTKHQVEKLPIGYHSVTSLIKRYPGQMGNGVHSQKAWREAKSREKKVTKNLV